jgi:rod shape-determining protein MreD
MSTIDPASAAARLRGGPARPARRRSIDAEVSVAPRFSVLVLLGLAAVLLQSTLLHDFTLRGAHVSLITVLLVWTGLRCGVVTGGWLGLVCGLLEDALGGSGANVLGATLVGFLSGLLANRFFSDSLAVFLAALAGATALRYAATYMFFEFVFGERGLFRPLSHEFAWATLLNCLAGTALLLGLRVRAHWSMRIR